MEAEIETRGGSNNDATDYIIFPNDDDCHQSEELENGGERETLAPLLGSDKLLVSLLCLAQGISCMGFAILQVFFPQFVSVFHFIKFTK